MQIMSFYVYFPGTNTYFYCFTALLIIHLWFYWGFRRSLRQLTNPWDPDISSLYDLSILVIPSLLPRHFLIVFLSHFASNISNNFLMPLVTTRNSKENRKLMTSHHFNKIYADVSNTRKSSSNNNKRHGNIPNYFKKHNNYKSTASRETMQIQ